MSWRPKGWSPKNIHGEKFGYTSSFTKSDEMLFEEGADAMLEALKSGGSRLTGYIFIPAEGRLIVIPEESSSAMTQSES